MSAMIRTNMNWRESYNFWHRGPHSEAPVPKQASLMRVSYLDLADFIVRHCSNVPQQLEELWKRILLSVLIANTDDHLRNHSFLLGRDGTWQLAPAYDINPAPFGTGLRLNISETDNLLDVDLVESVAPSFRVSALRAKELIKQMKLIVSTWAGEAKTIGVSRQEIQQMQQAFRA